jgi:hypothetical protein
MGILSDIDTRFWEDIKRRFWAKVNKQGPNGCWIWIGSCNDAGYGAVQIYRGKYYAHRLSYEWHCGEISNGFVVMHRCDTPACVNPSHLCLGTQAENMQDKISKGRQRWVGASMPGERNPAAIITAELAEEIRKNYRPEEGYRKLGERYGLSKSQTFRIVTGKSWK